MWSSHQDSVTLSERSKTLGFKGHWSWRLILRCADPVGVALQPMSISRWLPHGLGALLPQLPLPVDTWSGIFQSPVVFRLQEDSRRLRVCAIYAHLRLGWWVFVGNSGVSRPCASKIWNNRDCDWKGENLFNKFITVIRLSTTIEENQNISCQSAFFNDSTNARVIIMNEIKTGTVRSETI